MRIARCLAAAIAALCLPLPAGAAAQKRPAAAPAPPKADIVGVVRLGSDVPLAKRTAEIPVVILRGHKRLDRIANNTPLYPDDRVFLTKGATAPIVAIVLGKPEKLDARYEEGTAGLPVPHSRGRWLPEPFAELKVLWPIFLDLPKPRPAVLTTPNGTKGATVAAVEPARLLPAAPQNLTVGRGKVVLPVVWAGGPALVRLSRQCSVKVEEEFSGRPGFVEITASRLAADDYCLDIWPIDTQRRPDRSAGFTIPMKVTVADRPALEEQDAVLAAVRKLKGAPDGRLQGLVDVKIEAADSFKAWAVYRSIEDGEQSVAAPRPAKGRAR